MACCAFPRLGSAAWKEDGTFEGAKHVLPLGLLRSALRAVVPSTTTPDGDHGHGRREQTATSVYLADGGHTAHTASHNDFGQCVQGPSNHRVPSCFCSLAPPPELPPPVCALATPRRDADSGIQPEYLPILLLYNPQHHSTPHHGPGQQGPRARDNAPQQQRSPPACALRRQP